MKKDKKGVKEIVEFWARFCHGLTLKELSERHPDAPILIHFKNVYALAIEQSRAPKRVARGSSLLDMQVARMSRQSLSNQFSEMMKPGGKNGGKDAEVPASYDERGKTK
jgi:hypothetical protein